MKFPYFSPNMAALSEEVLTAQVQGGHTELAQKG